MEGSHANPKEKEQKNLGDWHLRPGKAEVPSAAAVFRWKLHDEQGQTRALELHYHHNLTAIHRLVLFVSLICFIRSLYKVNLIHKTVAHHE